MNALASAFALLIATSETPSEDTVVSGYVKVIEATALVFDTKEDMKRLNVFKCYNVGVDRVQRGLAKKMSGRRVYMLVGPAPTNASDEDAVVFYEIDGLPFQDRCIRKPSFLLKTFVTKKEARKHGFRLDNAGQPSSE